MTYIELLIKLIVFIPILLIGVSIIVPKKVYRYGVCILLFNSLIILVITTMLLIFNKNTLLNMLYAVVILGSIITIYTAHDNTEISKDTRLLITRVCVGVCVISTGIAIFFFL